MNRGGLMNYYIGLVPFTSELYLQHYGVKGMKWGVRRYQNPDGTFTKAGKVRYAHLYKNAVESDFTGVTNANLDALKKNELNRIKKDIGIKVKNKNTEILKKGTKVSRAVTGDETVDDRRKYVSVTENDKINYAENFLDVWGDDKYVDEYELTKDIKIATTKRVTDWIVNEFRNVPVSDIVTGKWEYVLKDDLRYGWKSVNDILNDPVIKDTKADMIDNRGGINGQIEFGVNYMTNKNDVNLVSSVNKRLSTGKVILSILLDRTMTMSSSHNSIDKMLNDLKKDGYDAVVDFEDYVRGVSEYPLILLNPADSSKRTKHQKYADYHDQLRSN